LGTGDYVKKVFLLMLASMYLQEGMCCGFRIFPSHSSGPEIRYNETTDLALVNFRAAYNRMDVNDIRSLSELEERAIAWQEAVFQANKELSLEQLWPEINCSGVSADKAYAVATFAVRYGVATDEEKRILASLHRCGVSFVGSIDIRDCDQWQPLPLPEWNKVNS
jgi:hypothetical protein